MLILVISIIVLGLIAATIGLLQGKRDGDNTIVEKQTCSTCTGDNAKCEQDCMLEAATREIEYYDDEELDTFRGRPSDGYDDDEAEQFAEVLYTMQPSDVKGWNRSLILRGINVPDQIKDELLMMINDEHI